MKKYFVHRKIDSSKSEILAQFDNAQQAAAYKHPFYKTFVTSSEVPDAPLLLREVAITGLSYKVAEVVDYDLTPMEEFKEAVPKKVRHYVIRGEGVMSSMIKNTSLRDEMAKKLTEKFNHPVQILAPNEPINGSSSVLKVEDATFLLSPGVQQQVATRFKSTIVESNEERPCPSGFMNKLKRAFKKLVISAMWRFWYRKPHLYAVGVINFRYGLPVPKLVDITMRWTHEVFVRRISPVLNIAVQCTEDRLVEAGQYLSQVIESEYGASVVGSIAGLVKVPLADVVGDGRKRYALWLGLAVKPQLSGALNEILRMNDSKRQEEILKRYLITVEGHAGHHLPGEVVPEIEVVNL